MNDICNNCGVSLNLDEDKINDEIDVCVNCSSDEQFETDEEEFER